MEVTTINREISVSATAFINNCDHHYARQIQQASECIIERLKASPVVLLAGPSGSGKTTTAENIARFLANYDISCYMVSMDDYYRDRDSGDYPVDENGNIDLESPLGLDVELLNRHMDLLEQGEEIEIPHFDFNIQQRVPEKAQKLRLQPGEAVVFEGINALNPLFAQNNPNATRVFIAPVTPITRKGQVIFDCEKIRLLRRIVRDFNYRSHLPVNTLNMWPSVRRGERLYIEPYADSAHVMIDTMLGYEVSVLGYIAKPMLEQLPPDAPQQELVQSVLQALRAIAPIAQEFVPEDSILSKEFLRD